MEKKFEILSVLQQSSNQFLSGEQLCHKLGVSRNAIWKIMNALRADGYPIEAVTNKGYRLVHSPDLISEYEIQHRISTEWIGSSIEVLDSISSTNEYAKNLVNQSGASQWHGHVIFADRQTAGKAKQNTSFYSPQATGIYITVILCPNALFSEFEQLKEAVANTVSVVIQEMAGIQVELLAPNEFLYKGKKLGGFLTDLLLEGESGRIQTAIAGLGIYINEEHFPQTLADNCISLRQIVGEPLSRLEWICRYLTELEQRIPKSFLKSS